MCGRLFASMQAAWDCEDRDLAEQREERRPPRHALTRNTYWEDDD